MRDFRDSKLMAKELRQRYSCTDELLADLNAELPAAVA